MFFPSFFYYVHAHKSCFIYHSFIQYFHQSQNIIPELKKNLTHQTNYFSKPNRIFGERKPPEKFSPEKLPFDRDSSARLKESN